MTGRTPALVAALLLGSGCQSRAPDADTQADSGMAEVAGTTCPTEATKHVELLGSRMRQVSLLAPDSVVARALTDAYSAFASEALIASWRGDPRTAPGREVSNPWPARIEVREATRSGSTCRVSGEIVYVTSADTTTAVERRSVTIELSGDQGWRVISYTVAAVSATRPDDGENSPKEVVGRYYAAIDARRFEEAYRLWSQNGAASGKSLAEFSAGFAETAQVRATVGDSVRMEGAAGSQFATVPVTVDATKRNGTTQHFTGTYTLRRSMVDGATPAQRTWHIFTAALSEG